MLTNMINENTILLKFQKVALCLGIISQRAVKAWIIAKSIEFMFVDFEKRLFMDFGFQKCFRDLYISFKRLILIFLDKQIKECMKMTQI
jgi:hypothetical protein